MEVVLYNFMDKSLDETGEKNETAGRRGRF